MARILKKKSKIVRKLMPQKMMLKRKIAKTSKQKIPLLSILQIRKYQNKRKLQFLRLKLKQNSIKH
jgi:hypothetical protein